MGISTDISDRKRAEEALRESERRFRTLIEHSFDGIVLVGPYGTVQYLSPSMRTILGYAEEDLLGSDSANLVHPDNQVSIAASLGRLVQHPGGAVHAEYRFRSRDGQYRWLEVVATNLLQEPVVGAVVLNIRDCTERKWAEQEYATLLTREQAAGVRAEQAEANLGAIIAGSPLPIVTFDRRGQVGSWNAAAKCVFGWGPRMCSASPPPGDGRDAR